MNPTDSLNVITEVHQSLKHNLLVQVQTSVVNRIAYVGVRIREAASAGVCSATVSRQLSSLREHTAPADAAARSIEQNVSLPGIKA